MTEPGVEHRAQDLPDPVRLAAVSRHRRQQRLVLPVDRIRARRSPAAARTHSAAGRTGSCGSARTPRSPKRQPGRRPRSWHERAVPPSAACRRPRRRRCSPRAGRPRTAAPCPRPGSTGAPRRAWPRRGPRPGRGQRRRPARPRGCRRRGPSPGSPARRCARSARALHAAAPAGALDQPDHRQPELVGQLLGVDLLADDARVCRAAADREVVTRPLRPCARRCGRCRRRSSRP